MDVRDYLSVFFLTTHNLRTDWDEKVVQVVLTHGDSPVSILHNLNGGCLNDVS